MGRPDRELVRTFTGHKGEVNTVVATSRGHVASASDDGTVRVWDTETGRQIMCLAGHLDGAFGLAASRNGAWLASGCAGGRIQLWDLRSGTRLWTRDTHSLVESLSFSPDDQAIVSGHFDGMVHWWDRKTGELIFEDQTRTKSSVSAVYSPNFSRVAVGGRMGLLATYKHVAKGWETVAAEELDQKAIGIHGLAFSPRDNTLAIGRRDGLIELWNAGPITLKPSRILPGHGSRVWSVAWSPDGRLLASAATDGSIKLWNATRSRYWCKTYPRLSTPICSIAVAPDQRSIITGSMDGQFREWDRTSRQVRRIAAQPQDDIAIAAYLGNQNVAIAAGPGTSLQQWDLVSGDLTSLAQLPERVCSQAISGKLIAVGCVHSTAVLFDAATGRLRHRLKTKSLDVEYVALSPDGKCLATAGVGEEIELWNTQTGQLDRTLAGHPSRTLCLGFSPDGAMLASGGSDRTIHLWDVASGRLLATLVGESAAITALAISPDGRNLASGSSQPGSIQLWDLTTYQPLTKTGVNADTVTALTFTHDGRTVIAGMPGAR